MYFLADDPLKPNDELKICLINLNMLYYVFCMFFCLGVPADNYAYIVVSCLNFHKKVTKSTSINKWSLYLLQELYFCNENDFLINKNYVILKTNKYF